MCATVCLLAQDKGRVLTFRVGSQHPCCDCFCQRQVAMGGAYLSWRCSPSRSTSCQPTLLHSGLMHIGGHPSEVRRLQLSVEICVRRHACVNIHAVIRQDHDLSGVADLRSLTPPRLPLERPRRRCAWAPRGCGSCCWLWGCAQQSSHCTPAASPPSGIVTTGEAKPLTIQGGRGPPPPAAGCPSRDAARRSADPVQCASAAAAKSKLVAS